MMGFKGRKSSINTENHMTWRGSLSLFLGFIFFLFCTALYLNWSFILEKLDNNRTIQSFVLTHPTTFTQNDDIRDSIEKMGGLKGFFSQDIHVVRKQLENITWVKSVQVRKIWPDKLSIGLTEYEPVAIWNDHDFLSSEGDVFQLPRQRLGQKKLPHLAGPDYQSHLVLTTWKQIDANLKRKGVQMKKLAIDARGAWQVTLENDVLLHLGRGAWQPKLERFATIYPQIEVPEGQRLSYMDLRYAVGAAVGFSNNNVN